jgi:hypothetical protein
MKAQKKSDEVGPVVEIARNVLKDMLRRSPVSLDEIGRQLGHVRGYMSRALRGANPLTLGNDCRCFGSGGHQTRRLLRGR